MSDILERYHIPSAIRKIAKRAGSAGAISLQQRIGRTIESIKRKCFGQNVNESKIVRLENRGLYEQ